MKNVGLAWDEQNNFQQKHIHRKLHKVKFNSQEIKIHGIAQPWNKTILQLHKTNPTNMHYHIFN